jgi:autotransporter-associated beta strand protein/T5SS/PEP-CTERM-associated repeat protein
MKIVDSFGLRMRACGFVLLLGFEPTNARAATFTVTNTNAAGAGSLSNAIAQANLSAVNATNFIQFAMPPLDSNTVQTITLPSNSSPLPQIIRRVVIDGYTQPGAISNTNAIGNNAKILIKIDGSVANPGLFGLLQLNSGSDGSVVRGLCIVEGGNGIPIISISSQSNTISGNFLGVDTDGATLSGSGYVVEVTAGMSGNIIGGASLGARNVMVSAASGFTALIYNRGDKTVVQGNYLGVNAAGTAALGSCPRGIHVSAGSGVIVGGTNSGAANVINATSAGVMVANEDLSIPNNTVVQGNLIGTDATGTTDLRTLTYGVQLQTSVGTLIGGTSAGAANVISSAGDGIFIANSPTGALIQGNKIGTDITGTISLGNNSCGIEIFSLNTSTTNGTIGGTGPGQGNIIAFNHLNGVSIAGPNTGWSILGNSIHDNGGLGITLAGCGTTTPTTNDSCGTLDGANHHQMFPVITGVSLSGGNVTLSGSLNSTSNKTYRLEFFSNPSCDPSGFGQGTVFLGFTNVTTDASCSANFALTLPNPFGQVNFTATATDTNGNTSEFSACANASGPCAIICPTNMIVSTSASQCGATVFFTVNTTGNCGAVTSTPPSGSFFSKGTNTVICSSGGGNNCSFTIAVIDTVPPSIVCPANIVTNVPFGQSNAVVNYTAVFGDNCGLVFSNSSPPSGSVFPLGVTTVSCTAADTSGNTNFCNFTVTVSVSSNIWSGAGADNNWTTPQNWVGNVTPTVGGDLFFPAGALRFSNTNTFPAGTVFNSITFSGTNYVINGNALVINAGITNNAPAFPANHITCPINLASNQSIACATNTTLLLDGAVSGAAGLVKVGPGFLTMTGPANNTYSGTTVVNDGTLLLLKAAGTNAFPGALTIGDGLGGPGADVVRLGNSNQIPDSAPVTINSSGALDLNGKIETIGPLSVHGGQVLLGATSLKSGNTLLDSNAVFSVALNGEAAGTQYGQLGVTGSVTLSNATLASTFGFTPALGDVFKIIDNDGSDPVIGTFLNLSEGALLTNGAVVVRISYAGGDGNDVTLTSVTATNMIASGQTRVWIGSGTPGNQNLNWSNPTNWSGGLVPTNGDSILFGGNFFASNTTNNIAGLIINNIAVQASSSFDTFIYGNGFTLLNGLSVSNYLIVNVPITLAGDQIFYQDTNALLLVNQTLSGGGALTIVASGAGATPVLAASNNLSGPIAVPGVLEIDNPYALGGPNSAPTTAYFLDLKFAGTLAESSLVITSSLFSASNVVITGNIVNQQRAAPFTNTLTQFGAASSAVLTIVGNVSGPGGLAVANQGTVSLNGTNDFHSSLVEVDGPSTLLVQGTISSNTPMAVFPGGTIGGSGTIGNLASNIVDSTLVGLQGTISPGSNGPGVLTTANLQCLNLISNAVFHLKLNGPIPGNYDQIKVKGFVDLNQARLEIVPGFIPALGSTFTIIDNDGVDAVINHFAGLPEGSSITNSAAILRISYQGGDGNDVVLTVTETNAPPVALCRNVTTNADANCQAFVNVSAVDNGSFDSDGTITNRTLTPPGPYPKGTNAVTLTVVDNQGATNSCTANVIVLDITPPAITCPANITTNAPAGQTSVVVNYPPPSATDLCSTVTVNSVPAAGSAFPVGVTVVTCTATDSSGNTNSCSFTVTVNPTGTNRFWINPLGGGYQTVANWLGSQMQQAYDNANFTNNTSYEVLWSSDASAASAFFNANSGTVTQAIEPHSWTLTNSYVVGQNAGATGTVTHVGGTLVVTNSSGSATMIIGQGGIGTYNLDGGNVVADLLLVTNNGSSFTASVLNLNSGNLTTLHGSVITQAFSSSLAIGAVFGQSAAWNVLGGTNLVGLGPGTSLAVGGTIGATGDTLLVSGPATVLSNNVLLAVGGSFNSSFNTCSISNGARLSTSSVIIGGNGSTLSNLISIIGSNSFLGMTGQMNVGEVGSSNQLQILGGGVVSNASALIGQSSGANGNLVQISGPGSAWLIGGTLAIGQNGASNRLVIDAGGSLSSAGATVGSSLGANANSVLVTGPGSLWTDAATLDLGAAIGNSLVISNGGQLHSASAVLGFGGVGRINNYAIVSGAGSVWSNSADLTVGTLGTGTSLVISNSAVLSTASLTVGSQSGTSNHLVSVSAGTLEITNVSRTGTLDIRRGTNQLARAGLIEADQLVLTNALGFFEFDAGTLNVRTTTVTNAQTFFVGDGTNAATLNVVGNGAHLFANGLTVRSNALLIGNGTISGPQIAGTLSVQSGGTVAPGNSIGIISLNNPPGLNGSLLMEISKSGGVVTNDQLQVLGPLHTLSYGGTLTVTRLGADALARGDRFPLFSASSYGGAFTQVTLPALGPGLAWTNKLLVDGSIQVISLPVPLFSALLRSGSTNLVFSGTGGPTNAPYRVLTSTNVALPLTNWVALLTNQFDANGIFTFTNSISPSVSTRFYRLSVP